jgi:hypothetical protein
MYGDSDAMWDGVHWDGNRASFVALRETDEDERETGFSSTNERA